MLCLKTPKPLDFVRDPSTLCEHLKKRRKQLGMYQKDVAELLGISEWTYLGWEVGDTMPAVRFIPKVIDFLGYDPFPEGNTFPERIRNARERRGLNRIKFAQMVGVSQWSIEQWEKGMCRPNPTNMRRLLAIAGDLRIMN